MQRNRPVPVVPPEAPTGSIRVYLASRFARQQEMVRVGEELEADGLLVTSRWLKSPAPLKKADLEDGSAAALAAMDLSDLRGSDACIAFTEPEGSPGQGRGGRHVELGIAVGLELPILLVGPREHVFHALPTLHWAPNWETGRALISSGIFRRDETIRISRAA